MIDASIFVIFDNVSYLLLQHKVCMYMIIYIFYIFCLICSELVEETARSTGLNFGIWGKFFGQVQVLDENSQL